MEESKKEIISEDILCSYDHIHTVLTAFKQKLNDPKGSERRK